METHILHINVWMFDFSFEVVVAPYQQVRGVRSTWALVGKCWDSGIFAEGEELLGTRPAIAAAGNQPP